jgi:hypothetical protein
MERIKYLVMIALVAGAAATIASTLSVSTVTASSPQVLGECPNPAPPECSPGEEGDRCVVNGMAWRGCKQTD